MKTYCVSCKKYTGSKNSSLRKTKRNRSMLSLNCAVFCKKKLAFIKNQEIHNFNYISNN